MFSLAFYLSGTSYYRVGDKFLVIASILKPIAMLCYCFSSNKKIRVASIAFLSFAITAFLLIGFFIETYFASVAFTGVLIFYLVTPFIIVMAFCDCVSHFRKNNLKT